MSKEIRKVAWINYNSKQILYNGGHYSKFYKLLSALRLEVARCYVVPKIVNLGQFKFTYIEQFFGHPLYEVSFI